MIPEIVPPHPSRTPQPSTTRDADSPGRGGVLPAKEVAAPNRRPVRESGIPTTSPEVDIENRITQAVEKGVELALNRLGQRPALPDPKYLSIAQAAAYISMS